MSRLVWDQIGERTFETGVDRGVLFPFAEGGYPLGVAWSGLTNITETPSGAEDTSFYADNIKYLTLKSAEELGLTLECYTYPDEWEECNGSKKVASGVYVGQQARKTFGLAYRTKVGNDTEGYEHGYKIHLIWGCSASPSERNYGTINDSPEPNTFSYEISTTPVNLDGYNATSIATVESVGANPEKLKALEDMIWGTEESDPKMPMPNEIVSMFAEG